METWKNIYVEESSAIAESLREIEDILVTQQFVSQVPEYLPTYLREVIKYNLAGEKNTGGHLTTFYTRVIGGEAISQDKLTDARRLANFINFSQASQNIANDTIDNELKRDSRPCWHKVVGPSAINDVNVLVVAHYILAQLLLSKKPYWDAILRSMSEAHFLVSIWQRLDAEKIRANDQWTVHSLEFFTQLASARAAFHSTLPLKLAFHLCEINDQVILTEALKINEEIGRLHQATKDWHNWAAWDHDNLEANGDLASHIRKGKCSYSSVIAWLNANDSQRKKLVKYHGVDQLEAADHVIRLYKEVGVPDAHRRFNERRRDNIFELIDSWNPDSRVPPLIFPPTFLCIDNCNSEVEDTLTLNGAEVLR